MIYMYIYYIYISAHICTYIELERADDCTKSFISCRDKHFKQFQSLDMVQYLYLPLHSSSQMWSSRCKQPDSFGVLALLTLTQSAKKGVWRTCRSVFVHLFHSCDEQPYLDSFCAISHPTSSHSWINLMPGLFSITNPYPSTFW